MSKTESTRGPITPGWGRVADRLRAARIELGYQRRSELVNALMRAGRAKLSVERILGDLERGARANYSPSTLSAAEAWYGLAPGEIRHLLAGDSQPSVHPPGANLPLPGARPPKVSDPGYTSMPTILSRLDGDRLVELLHAIATELGARAKHDDDDPVRLIGAVRLDLNGDLAELDQELD